ncbi:type II toxin-antitoxin system Phd/YefM family antitoxin [Candidatus Saccharibacteria bacterium]|nr:type II toxin-antitoxin system Phd/YefM family antitoxin [Candidatus Saccharibacteria bacterium]
MVTMTATKARSMFYTLVNDEDEPVTITGKNKNKVLVDEDDWRAMEETVYLSSIPGLVESIREAEESGEFISESELEW